MAIRYNFPGLAAEHEASNSPTPMRPHYEEIAIMQLGCFNDSLSRLSVSHMNCLNLDTGVFCSLLRSGQYRVRGFSLSRTVIGNHVGC